MEFHGSERRTTRSLAKKRKPLTDLTNADAGSVRLDAASCPGDKGGSKYAAVSAAAAGGDDPPSPSTPFPNSPGNGNGADKREVSIIYTRRRRKAKKTKRKEPAAAASCPPVGKIIYDKQKEVMEDANLQQKTYSVPYGNHKKEKKFTLPQDFIEKQRAYFAEVDAHELLVEEVSESELD